jgi:hypothetical protein
MTVNNGGLENIGTLNAFSMSFSNYFHLKTVSKCRRLECSFAELS